MSLDHQKERMIIEQKNIHLKKYGLHHPKFGETC